MNIDFIESLTRFKLDGENAVQLKTVGELISPHLDTVLERFYAGVQQDDSAVSFFTGGAPQMSRARSAQKAHW
jgi:truncated hemoglobin YjbI